MYHNLCHAQMDNCIGILNSSVGEMVDGVWDCSDKQFVLCCIVKAETEVQTGG